MFTYLLTDKQTNRNTPQNNNNNKKHPKPQQEQKKRKTTYCVGGTGNGSLGAGKGDVSIEGVDVEQLLAVGISSQGEDQLVLKTCRAACQTDSSKQNADIWVNFVKSKTHRRFKRMLFIRTKHKMLIFRVIPFIKLQNDT